MDRSDRFAKTLKALLVRTRWSTGKLAEKSRVSRATIENWLRGASAGPRIWQPIAQIAAALELDVAEASQLLASADHPSISELLKTRLVSQDRALLKYWASAEHQAAPAAAFPPPAMLTPQSMPIADVEPVTPLPSCSHMYLWRNPYFVGRAGLLLAIARTLSGYDRAYGQPINTVALTGIGGVGKSQLASEWVHRYGHYFPGGVFWINFSDPRAIAERIAEVGSHAFPEMLGSYETLPLDERVRMVWNTWHDGMPRLLVFDGCEDEALLKQWRPTNGTTSVIVTSRRAKWQPLLGVRVLPVPTLTRPESIELLQQYRPDCARLDADLGALAETLGDLPLALHLAGLYLDQYRSLTPAVYHAHLLASEQDAKRMLLSHRSMQRDDGVTTTDHEHHLMRTFERSYQQLDETSAPDSLALKILAHAAAFVPTQRVHCSLLYASVALDTTIDDVLVYEDALSRLFDLGLLTCDVDAIEIHRLVAQYVNASTLIVTARARVEAVLAAAAHRQR